MPSDPFESAIAKINRAKHHLQQFDLQPDGTRKKQAHGISFQHESQTDELVITAVLPRSLFVRYAIVAGEVIGQVRSALEHAVWELVPAVKRGRRTGFPVFTAETKIDAVAQGVDRYYDRDGLRMIDGVNSSAAAIIKGLQPFGPDYQTNLLYVLNELWNRDKHRLLNFCIGYLHGINLYFIHPGNRFESKMITVPSKVKDGTELFRERHPGAGVEVGAEVALSSVIFDGGLLDRQPVSKALLKLVEFSDRVISDLAKTI